MPLFPRFTLRWLMIAVPLAGLCLTSWIEIMRFEKSLRVARERSMAAQILEFKIRNRPEPAQRECVTYDKSLLLEIEPILHEDEPECP